MFFPNPTNDKATVLIEKLNITSGIIELYNITGALVKSEKFYVSSGNAQIEIDLTDLSSGIYTLKVNNISTLKPIKLVKH